MKTLKSVDLFYKEGGSDKEYHIQIQSVTETTAVVLFQYGRVGNALQTGTKTDSPVSLEDATKIFDKLQKEKERKGYAQKEGANTSAGFSETSKKN